MINNSLKILTKYYIHLLVGISLIVLVVYLKNRKEYFSLGGWRRRRLNPVGDGRRSWSDERIRTHRAGTARKGDGSRNMAERPLSSDEEHLAYTMKAANAQIKRLENNAFLASRTGFQRETLKQERDKLERAIDMDYDRHEIGTLGFNNNSANPYAKDSRELLRKLNHMDRTSRSGADGTSVAQDKALRNGQELMDQIKQRGSFFSPYRALRESQNRRDIQRKMNAIRQHGGGDSLEYGDQRVGVRTQRLLNKIKEKEQNYAKDQEKIDKKERIASARGPMDWLTEIDFLG